MGLDVHKRTVYITELDDDGNIMEQYEIGNNINELEQFRSRYIDLNPEIALEVSTTGKYIAGKLRDMGFHVHLADPFKLSIIFKSSKKNDREDSYKLAKLLRLNELPEVHLPSRESDQLRSLVRYRQSIGRDITMIKNRIHALLSSHGMVIDASDIFGKKGISQIYNASKLLPQSETMILSSMIERISSLRNTADSIEDQLSKMVTGNKDVERIMTIPGINIYSASVIISEIDGISRFSSKEKLASYAGLVPRQDQSGSHDIKGHITKRGSSILRFVMINAAHSVIKYSKRMRSKYLGMVRRIGKNRSVVAIGRILLETIYVMLKKNVDFIDQIDSLTERKIRSMHERAVKKSDVKDMEEVIKLIRMNKIREKSGELFS